MCVCVCVYISVCVCVCVCLGERACVSYMHWRVCMHVCCKCVYVRLNN